MELFGWLALEEEEDREIAIQLNDSVEGFSQWVIKDGRGN